MRYAPLHNHTVYSIKDAIAHPIDYVKFIHEYNNKQNEHEIVGLAITEHGNSFSTIIHHEACTTPLKNDKANKTIKPIYGNEIYHVEDLKTSEITKSGDLRHLVLLAKNDIGLKNLFKITSHAGLNKVKLGKKDYQITDEIFFKDYGEGIIASSACIGGKLGQLLIKGEYEQAKAWALKMNSIFDEFYLEIQPHDILPEQVIINAALLKMSKETGLELIITSDSHYIRPEDREYHDLMKDIDHDYRFTSDNHFWTPHELVEWCNKNNIPLTAISNTAKIADSCIADITPRDTKGLMPDYPCPDGYNEDSYLMKLVNEGLKQRFSINKDITNISEYITRINYELDVITQMGFSGYFLILWDWFKYCKENRIPLGPGRGSSGGSLVAYCLDITKVDPIKNGLIFERFLNIERVEMPDIDSDVSKLQRADAIRYLEEKYGRDYVCQILTFGQYKLKNTIKAVLSAERGFTADYQNSITKMIPDTFGEETVTYKLIVDIVENPDKYLTTDRISDRDYTVSVNIYNTLQKVFKDNPEVEVAIRYLAGTIASVGMHAGGVVISSKVISEHVPVMKGSDSAILSVCQTNMDGIHFLNALKIDVLGLKTLSQIRLCMDLASIPDSWLDNEDTDDDDVYTFLSQGNTANVFQMHKYKPSQMIRDFKVEDLEGLTAVNAGNRPGPLAKGENGKSMVDGYAESVKTGNVNKIDDRIDGILEPTRNMLWYQEQCQKIGQVMAGYSLGGADVRIRGVLAKKKIKQIPEIQNEFIYGKKSIFDDDGNVTGISEEDSKYCKGCIENGFSEEIAFKIFNIMKEFAKYSFNKSHSCCYAFLAYRTAWLSYYHPVEWNVACLTVDSIDGKKDKIVATLNSCKKREIRTLPPDINTSKTGFTVEKLNDGEKVIRFGFLAIKDVGKKISDMVSRLIEKDGVFTSFDNFLFRTVGKGNVTLRNILSNDPNYFKMKTNKAGITAKSLTNPFSKTNIVPLILSGAFDSLEPNRHSLYNQYISGRKDKDPLRDAENYSLKNKLAYELELLGFYVSQHPLDGDAFPYTDLDLAGENQTVAVAGIFVSMDTAKTKGGDKFYKIKIELRDGAIANVMVFKNTYTKHPACVQGLSGKRAKEGKEILIVEGKYSRKFNSITASSISKVRSSSDLEDKEVPEVSNDVAQMTLFAPQKESPLDDDLMTKVAK